MTQLERLARPFPAKYVTPPAPGKFGSYVPHDIINQVLLLVLGPFTLEVGQMFTGEDGRIEGCLVTLITTIDDRQVSVTEVGDCEQPGNWKTQGARMKDAVSDGLKRCAMRLGLGLHLKSDPNYFLYEQLSSAPVPHAVEQSGEPDASDMSGSPASPSPVDSPGGMAAGGGVSANQVAQARARAQALQLEKVSVASERKAAGLPTLTDDIAPGTFARWLDLLDKLDKQLEASRAPFEDAVQ